MSSDQPQPVETGEAGRQRQKRRGVPIASVGVIMAVILLRTSDLISVKSSAGMLTSSSLVAGGSAPMQGGGQLVVEAARVLSVRERMKSFKVIFAALTRDNMRQLPHLVEQLSESGSRLFDTFAFIFAENDSADGTKEYLENLHRNATFQVARVGEDFSLKKRPSISFLAKMRNYYLREAYKPEYDGFDYIIVFDADFTNAATEEQLVDSFNRTGWDVIAANGERSSGLMYDTFAFRTEELNHPYIPEEYGNDIDSYVTTILCSPEYAHHYPDGPLVPVLSAFGGMAIYRKAIVQGLLHNETSEDCEHVSLHDQISKRGGKLFVNPNLRLSYGGRRRFMARLFT